MSPTITVNILFFARSREIAGCQSAAIELPARSDVSALRVALIARFPELEGLLARCRIAIDESFAEETDRIRDGALAAVIPPVSGG